MTRLPPPMAADLYGEILLAETGVATAAPRSSIWERARAILPGIGIVIVAAMAAAFLAERYAAPIMLMGLLIGMALQFIGSDPRTHAGLDFAGRTCLRIGIVLLGTQIGIMQILAIGWAPFAALLIVMASAIAAALITARLFGQSWAFGMLAGGATAICGASAALALYDVLGKDRIDPARFTITLVGVAMASALAMSFYPALAGALSMSDTAAGFMIGASIHDVAQAVGGGFAYSREAGETATIVKLTRVALLPVVLFALALILARGGAAAVGRKSVIPAIPAFLLLFLALVGLNSLISLPQDIVDYSYIAAKALLLIAVTATAMRSRFHLLLNQGFSSFAPVIAATLASLVTALIAAELL
jgi:uncharacterized integral membrane protein (TIGR00698 family)